MHEIGVVMQVIASVEDIARQNGLTRIQILVLQIGELSSTVPRYVETCYPAAASGTMLEATELKIEILPGIALCRACGTTFRLNDAVHACPACAGQEWEITGGKEFMIKEIVAC